MAALPRWRIVLERALSLNARVAGTQARFVQLATLCAAGLPTVRTVTFRDFAPDSALAFAVDAGSRKIAAARELDDARAAACELVWYFPVTREQFRVRGSQSYIGAEADDPALLAERERVWATALTDRTRASFAHKDDFVLLLVTPDRVERLALLADPAAAALAEAIDSGAVRSTDAAAALVSDASISAPLAAPVAQTLLLSGQP